ncbi:DoxX family protein [Pseudazoarcus pumilus]|uniref:DoxX family protein n=1 Tax=Pseudazoarcus pumilus TaxID=2067960 RepID=A0A2I6S7I5_9RHOO|nr:DoxX family protein [Pseudazoarcus pumilus]AUN95191.1 DoxX family protein [Pseudazoarcus pumilus]
MSTNNSALAGIGRSLDNLAPLAWPIVRITTGLLLMPHGAQKLFGWFGGHGLEATGQFFAGSLGLEPGIVFAFLAGFVEFFGGLALVLGLLTRPAALGVAVLMGVAMTVHIPNGFFWSAGGYEYPLMWGLLAVAIFLRGGAEASLDRKFGLPF